jgi:hypothetical protein
MKRLLITLCVVGLAGSAHAESDYYRNVSGHRVHRPMHSNHAPAGATAHCRDGAYFFTEHHSGTCSHHGGVADWL